jgi:putative membrane protein
MKRYLLAASAALVLVACHKTADTAAASDTGAASSTITDTPSTAAPDGTTASTAAASAPALASAPAGPDFVATAAASDMYEIQAAKIAQKRSMNADIKDFAKMMVADHTKSTALVKKAIADSGRTDLAPPAALPDDRKAMIDALDKASDADFDKTYVDQQVAAHKDALSLMTGYSMSGDVPQLKDAAGKIAPTVQMHLDRITAIQASLPK